MKDDLMQSRGYLTTKIVHKASQFSIQTQQTVSHIKTKRLDTIIKVSEDCKSERDWVENLSDKNPTFKNVWAP